MNFSLSVWFRNLLRPVVTSAQVELYENGKQLQPEQFSDHILQTIMKEVDTLFVVEKQSPYWFETEAFEQCSCFKPRKTHLTVTCYTKDFLSNGYKKKFPIPMKYRKKMFDSRHMIYPEPVGSKVWSKGIQVKFSLAR